MSTNVNQSGIYALVVSAHMNSVVFATTTPLESLFHYHLESLFVCLLAIAVAFLHHGYGWSITTLHPLPQHLRQLQFDPLQPWGCSGISPQQHWQFPGSTERKKKIFVRTTRERMQEIRGTVVAHISQISYRVRTVCLFSPWPCQWKQICSLCRVRRG